MRNDEILLRTAEAVNDGVAVDWQAESEIHSDLKDQLSHLQAVEAIAAIHRSLGLKILPESGAQKTADVSPPSEAGPPELTQWGPLRIVEKIGPRFSVLSVSMHTSAPNDAAWLWTPPLTLRLTTK